MFCFSVIIYKNLHLVWIKKLLLAKRMGQRVATAKSIEIDQLPTEVLFKIFQYLDVDSLFSCATVCKRWEAIVNDNSFWKKIHRCFVKNSQALLDNEESCSSVEFEEKYWKNEVLTELKKARTQIISPFRDCRCCREVDIYSCLKNLGVNFQISLVSKDGSEKTMLPDRFNYTGNWQLFILYGTPSVTVNFEKIVALKVYSFTPILHEITGEMTQKSLCQKSLIFEEKIGTNFLKRKHKYKRYDTFVTYLTKLGFMIDIWKDTGKLEKIYFCMHKNLLLERCFFSSSNKIFQAPPLFMPSDQTMNNYVI